MLTGSFVYGEDCTVEEGKGYTSQLQDEGEILVGVQHVLTGSLVYGGGLQCRW